MSKAQKNKKLVIAIDGPAASGKSTTARMVAKKLRLIYVDTGAMYRAATLAIMLNNIDPDNNVLVLEIIKNSEISLKIIDGHQHTFLDDKDVTKEIRKPEIDKLINKIAPNPAVRKLMVKQQKALAAKGGVVMDGRDIGTVVLPNADLKIFMKASIEARAKRRLKEQGNTQRSLKEIKDDIQRRDHADSSRKESPLKIADNAKVLDNSNMSIDEQVKVIIDWTKELDSNLPTK